MPLNNDNNNECCKCTTPEYELILNEQGPQGRQGEKGNDGFSPSITVTEDNYNTYKLKIQTKDGIINTPNLKSTLPAGGNQGQFLMKSSSVDGDTVWSDVQEATETQSGIVQLATVDDLEPDSEGEVDDTKAVTPNLLVNEVDKINTTLEDYVTLDTNQTITGDKNFQGVVSLSDTRFGNQNNILMPNGNNYSGGFQVWDLITEGNFNPQLINANAEEDNGAYPGFGFLGNNPENTHITDNKYKNAFGVDLYGQSSHPLITIKNGVLGDIIDSNDIATTSKAGIVKPDGTTITIDADGTLHGAEQGTTDYNELTNKPSINNIELEGALTSEELGLAESQEIEELGNELNTLSGTVTTLQTSKQDKLTAGTNITISDDNIISATGSSYTLPQATATALGGIKANEKDDTDTQEVKIDPATGILYTKPGGGDITSIDGGNAQTNGVVAYQNTTFYANSAIVNNGLVGQDKVTIQDGEV